MATQPSKGRQQPNIQFPPQFVSHLLAQLARNPPASCYHALGSTLLSCVLYVRFRLVRSCLPRFDRAGEAENNPWSHLCFRMLEPKRSLYPTLRFDHSTCQSRHGFCRPVAQAKFCCDQARNKSLGSTRAHLAF